MKNIFSFLFLFTLSIGTMGAQPFTDSFTVNGDVDKFYPVTFKDPGYHSNIATELS